MNHMAAFNNAACQKSNASVTTKATPKNANAIGSQLTATNVNSSQHTSAGHHHQSMMNGHHQYTASSNGSPWFFNSRQQHNSHDSSLQVRNHPERGNPSFNASASFGLHSHHNGVYDTSTFMATQFPQHQPKANYLPSVAAAAASGFMGKKTDAVAEVNQHFRNSNSAYHCASTKSINITGMSGHCANSNSANLNSGAFFSATNGWPHHQNLLPTNTSSNNNGMLPQETVNMMTSQNVAPSSSIPRAYNRGSNSSCASANNAQVANSLNGFCEKTSCSAKGSSSASASCSMGSSTSAINGSHSQGQYNKNATCSSSAAAAAAAAASQYANPMPLSSNNSYLMQGFPSSNHRSGQNSFVDPTLGAKFAAAAAHHQVASDYAATFAASCAAAAAINSEYASYQQLAQKHQQYMSSINNFGANSMNGTNGHNNEYHHAMQQFDHTTNFNANRHSNNFINYPAPIFPMSHTDASMNTANITKSHHHNTLFDDFNYSTSAQSNIHSNQQSTNMNTHNALQNLASNHSNSGTKATPSRKSQSKKSQSYSKANVSVNNSNASFNEHQQFASSASCSNLLLNGSSSSCMVASASANNVARNSVSRCSSVASTTNHQPMQQQQQHSSSDSYSYNYSPATTNLSSHSPYQQRSSTSNSSHSSGASCAMSNSDYLSYGTPNPGPTVFPAMGSSQTPTPTPGYPTPPSSVGHSNSRCNSNEELSPYSSNSMSSSISHQSYGRNDFKSSSASSSSQISPKQLDSSSISDSMPQFNSSCMLASQKNAVAENAISAISSQSKHLLSAASNIFDATNPLDDSYKSQQFSVTYGNSLSSSAPASTCSNDMYSMNYNSESGTMPQLVDHQESLVDNGEEDAMDDSSYGDYHHYEAPENGQFDGNYSDEKDELPSCAQQQQLSPSNHQSNAHMIEPKGAADYQSGPEHESFNLNYNSVIQPIKAEHMPQEQQGDQIQVEQMPAGHGDIEMNTLNNLNNLTGSLSEVDDDKSAFPSIDDLNFISHSEEDNHCALVNQQLAVSSLDSMNTSPVNTIEHCSSLEFQSSHTESGHQLLVENTAMECNNIQSIIDSLPKPDDCMQTNKSPDDPSEILSQCSNSDSFLSDLAPLMNDNSKIALMESTFKSNNISSISKDLDIVNPTSFESNKVIFNDNVNSSEHNDDLKMDHGPSIESESEDNRLKDVDDFLKSNLNDEVQPEPPIEPPPPPKSNIEDTIDSVARQGLQDFDDEELELKLPVKSKKSPSTKKADNKKNTKESADNSNKSANSQSKFFKRKISDLPPEAETVGSSAIKKRKIAVVMPKSKEQSKKPNSSSEYDFLEGVVKDKLTKKIIKKPQPTTLETTTLTSSSTTTKVIKRQAKVQLKIEATKDSVMISSTKAVVEAKSNDTKLNGNEPAKNIPPQIKLKSVAEIAPSCSNVVNVKSNLVVENVQADQLVVPVQRLESISADNSPNSLMSETKENVAIINTSSTAQSKQSKHPNSSNKPKTAGSLQNKTIEKIPSDGVKKKPCEKPKAVSIVKNIKPKLSTTIVQSSKNVLPKSLPRIVSPKTSLGSIVSSSKSSTLLPQPSLMNATCLQPKPVAPANTTYNLTPSSNARLSNVTPTLIMNPIENQPVNSYVSPVTNAVLISIHPANSTSMSSLTAPSTFITLNTQNVSSSNNGNSTTNGTGVTQSSSSRRRSQDKKVATVREGHMRTGDFVVAEEEATLTLPVIWRIEGKSLLQRFEPSEQNGVTVYTNTSSVSFLIHIMFYLH